MDSLAEYVSNLLNQGYTEPQIRQNLLQYNYPQSMIDAAFSATQGGAPRPQPPPLNPVVEQLTSYFRTYLGQGYQIEQLKPALLQQGYKEGDVNQAIAAATGQKITHEVQLPIVTMMKLAFLLILGAGLVFGIIFLKGMLGAETPISPTGVDRLLDIELNLEKNVVEPGESIDAVVEIINMGDATTYDVKIRYQLLDKTETELWSTLVTKALATSMEDHESITFDKNLPDDTYTIRVTADYGGDDTATVEKQVKVAKEPETVEPPEEKEPEEEQPPQQQIVIISEEQDTAVDDAIDAAKRGDSERAEGLCLGITNKAKQDQCLTSITLQDNEATHCASINSNKERDSCYMTFVMQGEYEYCDKLISVEQQDLCQSLKMLDSYPPPGEQYKPNIDDFATAS